MTYSENGYKLLEYYEIFRNKVYKYQLYVGALLKMVVCKCLAPQVLYKNTTSFKLHPSFEFKCISVLSHDDCITI